MIQHTIAIGAVKVELEVPVDGPKPEVAVWFHECTSEQLVALAEAVGPGALNPVGGASTYVISATLEDELVELKVYGALAEDERVDKHEAVPLAPALRRIYERQNGEPQTGEEFFRG